MNPAARLPRALARDALLAAAALPLALLLAAPQAWPPAGWWLPALPAAALSLMLADLPRHLAPPRGTLAELLFLAGGALLAALLFGAFCALLPVPASPNPGFVAIHALLLGAALGLARIAELARPGPVPLPPPGQRPALPRPRLKPVSIEDLLDRPQVPLDREGMARLIQGRRVLVTGAGGTIGGELARQLATLGPEKLLLIDHGEYALYAIDLELSETHPALPRQAQLADIRDAGRIERLMQAFRPELVFHAAALKHVPMVERDPLEGLMTNALGTRIVADAAARAGCRAMVFISTDKAVNPTSVMGASKRLAEMYCQGLDREARRPGAPPEAMRCITVRFGNVLGSTGSVVPLFQRQLERGGPLTVTHPDMRRYFMTVREAVGLVLQASVIGAQARADQPPELADGGIFVLDMGEPVKIVDMARRMITLAGLKPDEEVEIRFTGLRPGEKLYEELFHGQEPPHPTQHPGLLIALPRAADTARVREAIEAIEAAARGGEAPAALGRLAALVPEFTPDLAQPAPLRALA